MGKTIKRFQIFTNEIRDRLELLTDIHIAESQLKKGEEVSHAEVKRRILGKLGSRGKYRRRRPR